MNIFCNAGRSYVYGFPNGKLVQCESVFYNRVIGDMINCTWNPVKDTKDLICPNYKACKGCDSYQSKQIIENEGNYKFIERSFTLYPRKESIPDQFSDDYVMYMITLNNVCNYDCIYCDWVERTKKMKDELTAEHIVRFFRMRSAASKGFISISPMGEPMVFPGFVDVINNLVNFGFKLNITSNMSKFKIVEELTSNKYLIPHIEFQMSLHPFAKSFDFDKYLGTVSMVKQRGFSCYSLMVGNPLQVNLFPKYKEELNKVGIELKLQEDESEYGKRINEEFIVNHMQTNGNRKLQEELNKL